ncbi:MAG: DUF4258 domain-containing protein [bacterium]
MKIEYSKHAKLKLRERGIGTSDIEKTVAIPDCVYYDLASRTMVAIRKVKIGGVETNLVVPFIKTENTVKIVTVYPCRGLEKELKKKEGARWVRIK